MSEIDNGGPAFSRSPATVKTWQDGDESEVTYEGRDGMSLRDYFAAKALCGLMTYDGGAVERGISFGGEAYRERTAREAYLFADAMLKVRQP